MGREAALKGSFMDLGPIAMLKRKAIAGLMTRKQKNRETRLETQTVCSES
jgi:hypothetical protein